MATNQIIVGSKECPISKVATHLKSSSSFSQFDTKWTLIANDLETERAVVNRLHRGYILSIISLIDIVHALLEEWVARRSEKAILQDFVRILEQNGLTDCADSLIKSTKVKQVKKYCQVPRGLQEFLKVTNNSRYCIICTLESDITCDKIRENVQGCCFLQWEEFLAEISSSGPCNTNNTMVVKDCKITDLSRINSKLIQLIKEGSKVVFVIPKDKENLQEVLNKLSSVGQTSQLYDDLMEWDDLTPFFQFKIIKPFEDKYKVQLGNEEFNGQVLVDLIKENEVKLFKKTLPDALNVYAERTVSSRKYISTEIFEQVSQDIFMFTGIDRHDLIELAKGKPTDTSSSQLQKPKLTVNFMILDQTHHFEEICEKSSNLAHLLQHENSRLQWVKSKGSISGLQKYIDKQQKEEQEDEFFHSLNFNSRQAIIISDSPGMRTSVILRRFGWKLEMKHPERTVVFLVFSKFIEMFEGVLNSEPAETIKKVLERMLCENALGEAILRRKLDLEEISIELLVDGLDEVHSTHYNLACKILQEMTNFKSLRLWVALRPHMLEEVENNLHVIGYNLKPLEETDRIKFLSLVKSQDPIIDMAKRSECVTESLRRLKLKATDNNLNKYKWNVLQLSACFGDLETLKYFLELGELDVNGVNVDGDTPLHLACTQKDDVHAVEKCKLLIKFGADWKILDGNKWNVLHISAVNGSLETLKYFLELGELDVNGVDGNGNIPLHLACGQKDDVHAVEKCKLLIRFGADWKILGINKWNVLHFSAVNGSLETLKYFLELGLLDVNGVEVDGDTPLHLACSQKDEVDAVEKCKLLIKSGADWKILSGNKWNVLHFSTLGCLETLKYFLELGLLDVNGVDENGSTPLHVACNQKDDMNAVEKCKLLIKFGADLKILRGNKWSVLHCSALGSLETLKYFLELGELDVNGINAKGITPLYLACLLKDEVNALEKCKLLMKFGANWKILTRNDQCNVLHFSAEGGNLETLKYFLELGLLDVNGVDGNGSTPLRCAILAKDDFNSVEKCKVLIKFGADWKILNKKKWNVLHYSAAHGSLETLKYFLELGLLDVNGVEVDGDTPLHLACAQKDEVDAVEKCKLLIKSGADWKVLGRSKWNVLHLSAGFGSLETLKYFLELGELDVNGVNGDGNTPLHLACAQKDGVNAVEKCKLLIKFGADWKILDKNKCNVLHFSAQEGHLEALNFFLDLGELDVNGVDVVGNTPLDYARRGKGDVNSLVKLIIEHGAESSKAPLAV